MLRLAANGLWAVTFGLIVSITKKFFVPQILDLRDIVKRARYDVTYYGNIFPLSEADLINRKNEFEDTSKELRVLSARLRSSRDNIPLYGLIEKTKLVPKWQAVEEAAVSFIGWSNEVYTIEPGQSGRQIFRKQIAKSLGMKSY